MQIKITLSPREEFSIPLSYNYQLQSSIYSSLKDNPQYANFIHDTGFGSKKTQFRLFTFGSIQGNYSIANGKMAIKGDISFEVRSPSKEFFDIYKRALIIRDKISLFGHSIDIRKIETKDIHITQKRVSIVTVSPIVARFNVKGGSTIYYSPDQAEFSELICRNIIAKYSIFTGEEAKDISFHYINGATKVVTRYKNIWVNAYHLKAELSGAPELLDFAYQAGLGSRSAQGFGMFEVV